MKERVVTMPPEAFDLAETIETDHRPHRMSWIPGGTFRMGSNNHYPEEAPVHRVPVDGFWIDTTPVTNKQFKQFIKATAM